MLGMLIFSVTGLATTCFELPTGLLSDKIGRKKTLTAGAIAGTVSVAFYAFAPGFALLLTGAVFEGLSRAFYSGNNSALLYDSLKEEERETEFHDLTGKVSSFFQIALALSAITGSLIAHQSFQLVMIISIFFQAAIIVISLFIVEPAQSAKEKESTFTMLKNAIIPFRDNKRLRRVSLANLISNAGGEAAYQFQSAFVQTLWPVWAIGAARTLSNLGAALSFWFSGKLISRFGEITMMMVSKIYSRVTSLIALIFPSMFSPVLLSSTSLFFGVSSVASESFNHKHFTDNERATMGSITSFAGALLFAIYSPLLGYAADIFGPGRALIISQCVMILPIAMLSIREKVVRPVH